MKINLLAFQPFVLCAFALCNKKNDGKNHHFKQHNLFATYFMFALQNLLQTANAIIVVMRFRKKWKFTYTDH